LVLVLLIAGCQKRKGGKGYNRKFHVETKW
jgi:hypothetical protein